MSRDVTVSVPDTARFSAQACSEYTSRFGAALQFPEGFDLDGWLPCQWVLSDGQTEDTGFEAYADHDGPAGVSLNLCAGDELEWATAWAIGAYLVATLGATLEDPQEDDATYGPDDAAALDQAVAGLLAEALEQ